MIGTLPHFVSHQRAVYTAEQRLDLAERDLFASVNNRSRSAAARFRYQQALIELELARTRLHKHKCDLAGRRHLKIVVT